MGGIASLEGAGCLDRPLGGEIASKCEWPALDLPAGPKLDQNSTQVGQAVTLCGMGASVE